MLYTLNPASSEEGAHSPSPFHRLSSRQGNAMVSDAKLANGGAQPPESRSLIQSVSACAGKAYSATTKALQPAGEAVVRYTQESVTWARAGGTWRLILLASGASLLACVVAATLALISVTATVGCSLLFFTSLLGLGALAAFLFAVSALAALVFLGSVLAAAAVIGAVASVAVCCVAVASAWALGAWAFFALANSGWRFAASLLTKRASPKRVDMDSLSGFSENGWDGKATKSNVVE